MKQTKVISAFPGTGRSFMFNKHNKHLTVLDSDSSKFDKKYFPDNYIKHIKDNIGKVDIIFVSTHDVVIEALIKNEIYFDLVIPTINLKEEYLDRYKKRNNTNSFIGLLNSNWRNWISNLYILKSKFCNHKHFLNSDEFISDRYNTSYLKITDIESSETLVEGYFIKKRMSELVSYFSYTNRVNVQVNDPSNFN